MDLTAAHNLRDKRLRRKLLSTLHLARAMSPKGGLHGRSLVDTVDGAQPAGQRFTDDGHALGLVRDLVAAGLVAEELLPRRRGQLFGLDFAFYRVTSSGSQLVLEESAPNPLVWDDRIPGDAE